MPTSRPHFSNNIGLKIRDCHDVSVTGLVGAGAGGDLVNVGQSGAGLTYNIQMNGVYNANWTNWFNDTINSKVYAGERVDSLREFHCDAHDVHPDGRNWNLDHLRHRRQCRDCTGGTQD